jgi:HSP20 family protein
MANVTRWDPFGEMLTLREAINGLFEDSVVQPAAGRGQNVAMPLDVAETPHAFIVEAVVPGIKEEDLDITLQNNVLTISGEVRQEQQSGEKPHFHRVERRYGRFSRTIGFPMAVQTEGVQASLANGILRLEVPKSEALKPRKITLNNNGATQVLEVDANAEAARAN